MIKIVRENINEKFTEDSDPVHDMGIGLPVVIDKNLKKIIEDDYDKIFLIDSKKILRHTGQHNSITTLEVKDGLLCIRFYSDKYYDKTGKEINKKRYAIQLFRKAGIADYLELTGVVSYPKHFRKSEIYSVWDFKFKIKPQYVNSFKPKNYVGK